MPPCERPSSAANSIITGSSSKLWPRIRCPRVAAAGVKLAHLATGVKDDEPEIPQVHLHADRPRLAAAPAPKYGRRPTRPPGAVTLFVGAGRIAGVRPADLFGAITNEAGIPAGPSEPSRLPTGSRSSRFPGEDAPGRHRGPEKDDDSRQEDIIRLEREGNQKVGLPSIPFSTKRSIPDNDGMKGLFTR